jgi:uncharacterized protein (TIGR02117 family)
MAGDESPTIVYIARRGWHIDIGLATADLPPPLKAVATDLPEARYIFFGFGDRHYLLAKNHDAPVLLSALWPGAAIILVTGLTESPEAGFGSQQVVQLKLSPNQARMLRDFIWRSMQSENGTLSIYRQGPYEDSLYFLATAKYSALHTCNTWVAQSLKAAGLHVHTAGVIFAGQLWSQIMRLKRTQDSQAPRTRKPRELPCSCRVHCYRVHCYKDVNCRAAVCRPGKPPWWSIPAEPPRLSSPAAAGCCC